VIHCLPCAGMGLTKQRSAAKPPRRSAADHLQAGRATHQKHPAGVTAAVPSNSSADHQQQQYYCVAWLIGWQRPTVAVQHAMLVVADRLLAWPRITSSTVLGMLTPCLCPGATVCRVMRRLCGLWRCTGAGCSAHQQTKPSGCGTLTRGAVSTYWRTTRGRCCRLLSVATGCTAAAMTLRSRWVQTRQAQGGCRGPVIAVAAAVTGVLLQVPGCKPGCVRKRTPAAVWKSAVATGLHWMWARAGTADA